MFRPSWSVLAESRWGNVLSWTWGSAIFMDFKSFAFSLFRTELGFGWFLSHPAALFPGFGAQFVDLRRVFRRSRLFGWIQAVGLFEARMNFLFYYFNAKFSLCQTIIGARTRNVFRNYKKFFLGPWSQAKALQIFVCFGTFVFFQLNFNPLVSGVIKLHF
jgi:hypothetical protein